MISTPVEKDSNLTRKGLVAHKIELSHQEAQAFLRDWCCIIPIQCCIKALRPFSTLGLFVDPPSMIKGSQEKDNFLISLVLTLGPTSESGIFW